MGRPLVGKTQMPGEEVRNQKETALSNASDFFWSACADKKASIGKKDGFGKEAPSTNWGTRAR